MPHEEIYILLLRRQRLGGSRLEAILGIKLVRSYLNKQSGLAIL
jgi:hypothetical protein